MKGWMCKTVWNNQTRLQNIHTRTSLRITVFASPGGAFVDGASADGGIAGPRFLSGSDIGDCCCGNKEKAVTEEVASNSDIASEGRIVDNRSL